MMATLAFNELKCKLSLPLKTTENHKIFGCFQGQRKGALGTNRLIQKLTANRKTNYTILSTVEKFKKFPIQFL